MHTSAPELRASSPNITKLSVAQYLTGAVRSLESTILAQVPEKERNSLRTEAVTGLIRDTAKVFGSTALWAAHDVYPVETYIVMSRLAQDSIKNAISNSTYNVVTDLAMNQRIMNNAALSRVLGDDMVEQATIADAQIDRQELLDQLVKELGKDGVSMGLAIGLPVSEGLAKEHGIDLINLKPAPVDFDDFKGLPTPGL